MEEKIIARALLWSVPQWYDASQGPIQLGVKVGEHRQTFFSHRRPTPHLKGLLNFTEEEAEFLLSWARSFPPSAAIGIIQEFLALQWLEQLSPNIKWSRILDYLRDASQRTYENAAVVKNIVITPAEGTADITDDKIHKLIDPLGSSSHVCLIVDPEIRLIDYREIQWGEVKECDTYDFVPEFLRPFSSILKEGEFSVHKTSKNDIVIMNQYGLQATKRKGRWKFYDAASLKNSLVDIFSDYRIGCNLFSSILDLSFRRHGALIVYDRDKKVLSQVANPSSIMLEHATNDRSPHAILSSAIRKIDLKSWSPDRPQKRRLFNELASIDGAVIVDSSQILAFGAMIRSHEKTGSHFGARTTAAVSALHWGGCPIKISSDGDVAIFFQSKGETKPATTSGVLAKLNFA